MKMDQIRNANGIATNEIINHRSSAHTLKKLIENSLKAGATSINVTVQDGGLKLLKIQDNGSGINNNEDFGVLVCVSQFTTLLASISHVAVHLTIIAKTCEMSYALKSSYSKGNKVLEAPKKASWSNPGAKGTEIIVEDLLFYNDQRRKNTLKYASEAEHDRVVEVVASFSVHNPSVEFSLNNLNNNEVELRTNPNSNQHGTIRLIYGSFVAKNLVKLTVEDGNLHFKLNGWISNLEYSGEKLILLLFINNQLVESNQLKDALCHVYETYLAKGKHPFAYLSIEIAPNCVDVHLQKYSLNEAIIKNIQFAVELFLKRVKSLPEVIQTAFPASSTLIEKPESSILATIARVNEKHLVQTKGCDQTIDELTLESVPCNANANQSLLNDEEPIELIGKEDKETPLPVKEEIITVRALESGNFPIGEEKSSEVSHSAIIYEKDLVQTEGCDQTIDESLFLPTFESLPFNSNASQSQLNKPDKTMGGESYKCSECSKTLRSKYYLKFHFEKHRKTKYVCNLCNTYTTFSPTLLERHKANAHLTTLHYCYPPCTLNYLSRSNLLRHQKKHQ